MADNPTAGELSAVAGQALLAVAEQSLKPALTGGETVLELPPEIRRELQRHSGAFVTLTEFYFEDIRVSQFLGQLADLFDELCAFASSSEGFPDKTMASFNHQELTNRINEILGQLKSVIKAMKSEMRF